MPSPRIEHAVLPAGEGPGQDRCFTADGLVVVLDGASAIDPVANPDATEYVDTLGPLLVEQITGTPSVDLRAALAEAIRQTAAKLALNAGTAPSSTVSVVRCGDEAVDILVLGDSPVVALFTDGTQETIVQHTQEHIAPDLRRLYRARLAAGFGYNDEHKGILRKIQRQEATVRNKVGGYYIAEASADAANEAIVVRFDALLVDALVLASDGAVPVIDELVRSGPHRLLKEDVRRILERHRDWEAHVDPEGRILPRSKKHDDKTLAVVTLEG